MCGKRDRIYGFPRAGAGRLTGRALALAQGRWQGLQTKGGTILECSGTNVMKEGKTARARSRNDALASSVWRHGRIGGDDTLGVANKLSKMGQKMIGVRRTIDNDLSCQGLTVRLRHASNIAMGCMDRLHTTAAFARALHRG
jgi:6-phosphofructokinase 1